MNKILFVASEAYPLIKTGGLADVAASLSKALLTLGNDIKILLPAYASVLSNIAKKDLAQLAQLSIAGHNVNILQTHLPGSLVPVLLVETELFSEREGNPYCGADGNDWRDNHSRFFLFAKVAEAISLNQAGLNWQPDIVHCNDWQTGLIPALLSLAPARPVTVFTIHNLTYRGLFTQHAFYELNLPGEFWHHEKLEFYGQMSFIKGGLAFADAITTVSPSYAKEIQTPEFGCGLDGLLRARSQQLTGILNGIDMDEWNPESDKLIKQNYTRHTLNQKIKNKTHLQAKVGLPVSESTPVFGFIGRLIEQKGVDLILNQINQMLKLDCQLVILGSGITHYEEALTHIAHQYPSKISLTLGYSEDLAHQIEAGADIFLMPSVFEPCGLNQMYSLRYGTLPIVHAVGGLKDTIIENASESMGKASNGFVFENSTTEELHETIKRAIACYHQPERWKALQDTAMKQDFSWEKNAKHYKNIYSQLLCALKNIKKHRS